RQFSTAKQFASWLGLTPKEHSSGGKQQLGGISKRGDGYFRYLLVHGARALTAWVNRNGAVEENSWLQGLLERKHYNVAVVAMAAKTARIMWSMLSHNTEYQPRQLA
ncbi:transposase, partial [Escherichia coli]